MGFSIKNSIILDKMGSLIYDYLAESLQHNEREP